jgi:hypothetical protein
MAWVLLALFKLEHDTKLRFEGLYLSFAQRWKQNCSILIISAYSLQLVFFGKIKDDVC